MNWFLPCSVVKIVHRGTLQSVIWVLWCLDKSHPIHRKTITQYIWLRLNIFRSTKLKLLTHGCRALFSEERLEKLRLFSRAPRRLRSDLIIAYNLSNGSYDLPIEEFISRPPCSSLWGYFLKFHHRRFRLNRRKAAFSVRIVEPWNNLPSFDVGSPSVDVFKLRLDVCWTEVYLDGI